MLHLNGDELIPDLRRFPGSIPWLWGSSIIADSPSLRVSVFEFQ